MVSTRQVWTGVVAATLALAALPAAGQQPPAQKPKVITNPQWVQRPTEADLARFYPPEAMRRGKGGRAVMSCLIQTTGFLKDCVAVSEEPRGMGFGAAAVGMATLFKMRPQTVDGVPQEGSVVVPISFECGLCTPAGASDILSHRVLLTPAWIAAPSFDQWKAAYPGAAKKAGLYGAATVECNIKADGGLNACDLTNENPSKGGFGSAALKLAPYFRLEPNNPDGTSRKNSAAVYTVAWTAVALGKTSAQGVPALVLAAPTDKVDAVYPKAAQDAGIKQGSALVSCEIGERGAPTNCAARNEAPAGMGFGAAAVALAPEIRFNLWTKEGLPASRRVSIPMQFGAPSVETASVEILSRAVQRLVQDGKTEEAKAVAEVIKRRFPNDVAADRARNLANYRPRDPEAMRLNNACWQKALAGKDLKGALDDCDRAIAKDANDPIIHDSRGFANLKAGNFKEAVADFDRAVALQKDYAHGLYGRGLAKQKAGDKPGGEADIAAAIKIDARVAGTFANYGL